VGRHDVIALTSLRRDDVAHQLDAASATTTGTAGVPNGLLGGGARADGFSDGSIADSETVANEHRFP